MAYRLENGPISVADQKRIADDVRRAEDALHGILIATMSGSLHPQYLKEKLDVVEHVTDFCKQFEKVR